LKFLITGIDGSSISSEFAFATLLFGFPLLDCDAFIVGVGGAFDADELRPKNSINSGLKIKVLKIHNNQRFDWKKQMSIETR
jgi:hypothetical protein